MRRGTLRETLLMLILQPCSSYTLRTNEKLFSSSCYSRCPLVHFSSPNSVGVDLQTTNTTQGRLLAKRTSTIEADGEKRLPLVAPVVDSDLLRFISEQKVNGDAVVGADDGSHGCDSLAATSEIMGIMMEEFSHQSVAGYLRGIGVERLLAEQAGLSVERHVKKVASRRRIRDFLKKRDKLWLTGGADVESQRLSGLWEDGRSRLEEAMDVLTEFALSPTDVAIVLKHTPKIALTQPRSQKVSDEHDSESGCALDDIARRAIDGVITNSLSLRGRPARRVLRRTPGLLTQNGCRRAEKVLELLHELNVSVWKLRRNVNEIPRLLTRSPAELFRLVAFLSSDAVRMPLEKISDLLEREDCVPLLDAVAPAKIQPQSSLAGQQQSTSGATEDGEGDLLPRQRVSLAYKRMRATAATLQYEIGTEDLGRVISIYPGVLLLDAKTTILPAARFLMDELGIWSEDLPSVLQLYPFLLGKSVEEMETVVSYLESLGVLRESLPTIFRAFPALLSMQVSEMQPVVEFLQEIGITNIGRFITRLPPVLGYSVENELKPKWEYISQVCLYPSFELSAFPAFFSYPLERVIKTRYEYLRDVKDIPTQLLALDLVVRHGDKDFATLVAKDSDEGIAFSQFMEARGVAKHRRPKRRRKKRFGPQSARESTPPLTP